MKKIVLTCVLVFSACCVTLFAQKDKKRKGNSENRMLLRRLYLPRV